MSAGYAAERVSAFPRAGIVRERLLRAKREAIDAAMEHGESWTTKVLNSQCGVLIDDIPRLLDAIGLKAVAKEKVCVDRELVEAMATMQVKVAPKVRELLWEEAE